MGHFRHELVNLYPDMAWAPYGIYVQRNRSLPTLASGADVDFQKIESKIKSNEKNCEMSNQMIP